MVKPTPDPPGSNLPPDHPLHVFPILHYETDGDVLAKRFAHQRTLIAAAHRDAQMPPLNPPKWWQFWRWRRGA